MGYGIGDKYEYIYIYMCSYNLYTVYILNTLKFKKIYSYLRQENYAKTDTLLSSSTNIYIVY